MPKLSNKYHKIMSVFKRDLGGSNRLVIGDWVNDEIKYLKDNLWEFTEKVDGTNIRIGWDGVSLTFGGRSDEALIPTPLMCRLRATFLSDTASDIFSEFGEGEDACSVTLYGEGCGKKIQKGGEGYCADGADFVLFDVKIGHIYLRRNDVDDIARKFGVKSVPIIGHGTLEEAIEMAKTGFKSQWGDFTAEGIVARPTVELFTRKHDRVIIKVKHKDFK